VGHLVVRGATLRAVLFFFPRQPITLEEYQLAFYRLTFNWLAAITAFGLHNHSSELNRGFRWYFFAADDLFYRVAIPRNLLVNGGLLALLLTVIDIENHILEFTIGHADGQDECE